MLFRSKRNQLFIVRVKQMEEFYVSLTQRVQQDKMHRHDIRHHFTMLREMNRDGLVEEIDRYLSEYLTTLSPGQATQYTGNYYIDALVYHFVSLAQREGIRTYVQLSLPSEIYIEPYDLCTIFGNCLENALEACQLQKQGYRFIRVQGELIQNKIILIFSNSFNGHILGSDRPLSTKPGSDHGYGIQSVAHAASHYGGQVNIDHSGNEFRISIVLDSSSHNLLQ